MTEFKRGDRVALVGQEYTRGRVVAATPAIIHYRIAWDDGLDDPGLYVDSELTPEEAL